MPVLLVAVRETFDVVEASLVVVVLGNCRSATLDAGVFLKHRTTVTAVGFLDPSHSMRGIQGSGTEIRT